MAITINGFPFQKIVSEGWDRNSGFHPKKPVRKSNVRRPWKDRPNISWLEPHLMKADRHETMMFQAARDPGRVLEIIEEELSRIV